MITAAASVGPPRGFPTLARETCAGLPTQRSPLRFPDGCTSEGTPAPPARGRMTYVLLIQDDSERNGALAGMLTARGFFVTTVRSAREAVDQTRSSGARPSVIILDLTTTHEKAGDFLATQAREP